MRKSVQQAGGELSYSSAKVQEPPTDSSNADVSEPVPNRYKAAWAVVLIIAVSLIGVTAMVFGGKPREKHQLREDTMTAMDTAAPPRFEYADVGAGKCVLPDGSEPKVSWKPSGDYKSMCNADETCLGYSESTEGSALLWYSGPLQGGGEEWGSCHCFVKQERALTVDRPREDAMTATDTAAAPAFAYADFGEGKCVLPDGSKPKFSWKPSGDYKSMCNADETCLGYSVSDGGSALLWYSGPLQGGGDEWGRCHCYVKQERALIVDEYFSMSSEGRGCGPGAVLAEPHVFKMLWQTHGDDRETIELGFKRCQKDCKANSACKHFVYDRATTFCGHYSACPVAGQPGTTFEKFTMYSVRGVPTPSLDEPEADVVETPGQQNADVEPEPVLPPGAVSGDAIPYPNIHLVGLGYNLFYSDPSPIFPENADPKKLMMDPGFRKPVFKIAYDDERLTGDRRHTQPDGYHATVDLGCSTSFSTKKIRDLSEYQTEQSQTTSMGVRAEASVVFPPVSAGKGKPKKKAAGSKMPKPGVKAKAFARVGGTLSYQTKDIQSNKRLRDSTMYRSNAKCSSYVVGLNFVQPPQTHPDFQSAVDALHDDPSAYYELFDTFGTHMLTTVKMGGRSAANMFVDSTKVNEVRGTANGFGVSVEASVGAVAKVSLAPKSGPAIGAKVAKKVEAKVNLLSPALVSAAKDLNRLLQRKTKSIVGPPMPAEGVDVWQDMVNENPVPIAFDSQPLCQHPAITEDADTYEKCEMFIESYCSDHLKPLGATCEPASPKACFTDLDCEDGFGSGFACREFDCIKIPECEVTLYKDANYRGDHYTLAKVNNLDHFGGKLVDLENANWWDIVSSMKLSKGCSRIEAIDDDGSCVLGKGDNRIYSNPGAQSLPSDLDNDVCKVKIFARKIPDGGLPTEDRPGWVDTSGLPTKQSSTKSNSWSWRAADGDVSGDWGAGSCTHTERERDPWWEMDMMATYLVKSVKIANRADCCGNRLNPFDITVDGNTCARSQTLLEGAYEDVQCNNPPTGRKIKIQVRQTTMFSLCEVEVYAQKMPIETPQWIDTRDFPTKQSSMKKDSSSQAALDGNPNGDWKAGSCTHTNRDKVPWWEMDMKRNYLVKSVKIANRADCCGDRLNPFDITVDDWFCVKRFTLHSAYEEVKCKNPPTGRHLRIRVQKTTEFSLCEVEVFGQEVQDPSRRLRGSTELVPNTSSVPDVSSMPSASEEDVLYAESFQVPLAPRRKLSDQESYLRNVGKSNYGYNHWLAAPASAEYAGTDPGFARRPIFATNYERGGIVEVKAMNELPYKTERAGGRRLSGNESSVPAVRGRRIASADLKAPDGWKVTKAESSVCQTEYVTRSVKSAYEYEAEMTDTFNPLLGRIDVGSMSFAYSSEESSFTQDNARFRKSMSKTGAECFDYQVEMDSTNPPATSENFKYVVDAVSTESEWYRLFDLFGLAYATHVNFGARYGVTQTITEKSYRTMTEKSSKEKISVEYTIGIPKVAQKTGVNGGITLSASYETKKSEKEINEQSEFFKDRKEFCVGKRVPADGGAEAWADATAGEPMPVRYTLVSICEHQEIMQTNKKNDCEKYEATYCTKHLTLMKEGVSCDPPQKRECLWDMDCNDLSQCSAEGACVPLPDCYVQFADTKLGPVYHRDAPMGKTYDLRGRWIDGLTVSKGCAEVVFLDEDKCREPDTDNYIVELRNENEDRRVDLPYDLENDVCKARLIPKKHWA